MTTSVVDEFQDELVYKILCYNQTTYLNILFTYVIF